MVLNMFIAFISVRRYDFIGEFSIEPFQGKIWILDRSAQFHKGENVTLTLNLSSHHGGQYDLNADRIRPPWGTV
jgi:hypothetical protein